MASNENKHTFLFGRQEYILLIAGIVLNLLGFILMIGGGSDDPNVFNYDELFSPVRLTVAPILILLGYAVIFYAIMRRRTKSKKSDITDQE